MTEKDMRIVQTLGLGTYGKVYKVARRSGVKEEELALKVFEYSRSMDCPWELEILGLGVPGCLYSLAKLTWQDRLAVLLPLASCHLGQLLEQKRVKKEYLLKSLSYSLLHLHLAGYYHLDIKEENVLLLGEELLLADFSLSRPMTLSHCQYEITTLPYRPPELLEPQTDSLQLNDKIDSWSLGMLLLKIYKGYSILGGPGYTKRTILRDFSSPRREKTLSGLPQKFRSFISGLLEIDPSQRLSLRSFFCQSPLQAEGPSPFPPVCFQSRPELVESYRQLHELVFSLREGSWLTCIWAVTLLEALYEKEEKLLATCKRRETLICLARLSFQLTLDLFFDYDVFFISTSKGKPHFQAKSSDIYLSREVEILLSLPFLRPPLLLCPYPHLTVEKILSLNGSA